MIKGHWMLHQKLLWGGDICSVCHGISPLTIISLLGDQFGRGL